MRQRSLMVLGCATLAFVAGCTDGPISVPLRALQSSGPVSFVCLDAPDTNQMALPLERCSSDRVEDQDDFSMPHLYALVTQPNSGDVAVIDLSTEDDAVVDQDPAVPGSNFLPVGAIPSDIVSTPGSVASFVISREARYEAIYGLPSDMIRGSAARLSSWPACALPSAPGEIELLLDPADGNDATRPTCDAGYGDPEPDTATCEGELHCHGDLSMDAAEAGKPGRYKLFVTLPSEGGIAIIDAQSVLDGEPGERDNCVIERWVPLKVDPPALPAPPDQPTDGSCVPQATIDDAFASTFAPTPAGITLDDDLMYVADSGAPVIHRIEMQTPCEPREIAPLVTTSAEDPFREVFTSRVAVSPLTLDLKRYLYAIDQIDGSIMVYDISDDSTNTLPLVRSNPSLNPFQPTDRIRFVQPPRDIVIVQHQNDEIDDQTGSTLPVRCDPTPGATGPGTEYRTSASFDSGAGPTRLRGVFAFAVLESGDVTVIDIDDYDAPCRAPSDQATAPGCSPDGPIGLENTDEFSCNVIAPHQPRSAAFLLNNDDVTNADQEPGLRDFPLLFDEDGSLLQLGDQDLSDVPRMTAPIGAARVPNEIGNTIIVGSDRKELDGGSVAADPEDHVLSMVLADPRAHILNQEWTVTYEGALPGFGSRFGELVATEDGFELRDTGAAFCLRGVRSESSAEATFLADGVSESAAASRAVREADFVQLFSETPVENDPYWSGQGECTFQSCGATFGTNEAPLIGRDLRVVEAMDDQLMLVQRNAPGPGDPDVKCCFPGVVEYRVRAGEQWVTIGTEVNFLNNMAVADDGTCRPSCDPALERRTGRALTIATDATEEERAERTFMNPFFAFAITADQPQRNMQFRFGTQGSFVPLSLTVVTNDSDVQPTAIRLLPTTGELVVSDGSLQGITLLDLNGLLVTRQFN